MKKNVILALLLLLAVGISTVLDAQTGSKKKKKKKKAKVEHTINTDSIAAARFQDSLAKVVANTPPPDTSHSLTEGLVADTSYLAYNDFPLDTTRPVDGFYKMPL